jgi:tetratricopeptide (TPR) repeat protein
MKRNILKITTKKPNLDFKKIVVLLACLILTTYSYSQTAQQHLESGQSKMKLKDVSGALNDFNKAISINPKFEQAIMNRALCQMALGNWSLAIPDCDRAIKLNPNQAVAYFVRGCAKSNTGKQGCEDLNKALELGYTKASLAINQYCK